MIEKFNDFIWKFNSAYLFQGIDKRKRKLKPSTTKNNNREQLMQKFTQPRRRNNLERKSRNLPIGTGSLK